MKRILIITIFTIFHILNITSVNAARYFTVDPNSTIIGEIKTVNVDERDTLLDVARKHGFGYQDIKLVNQNIDTWLPTDGAEILLPSNLGCNSTLPIDCISVLIFSINTCPRSLCCNSLHLNLIVNLTLSPLAINFCAFLILNE